MFVVALNFSWGFVKFAKNPWHVRRCLPYLFEKKSSNRINSAHKSSDLLWWQWNRMHLNHDTSNLLSFVKHPIFCCWKVSHIVFVCIKHTHKTSSTSFRRRKAFLAFGNDNFNSFLSRNEQMLCSYLFKRDMKWQHAPCSECELINLILLIFFLHFF